MNLQAKHKPAGYELCSDEMLNFLDEVWTTQGKTSNNCTGMSSFSFNQQCFDPSNKQRLTFYASSDCVIVADEYEK